MPSFVLGFNHKIRVCKGVDHFYDSDKQGHNFDDKTKVNYFQHAFNHFSCKVNHSSNCKKSISKSNNRKVLPYYINVFFDYIRSPIRKMNSSIDSNQQSQKREDLNNQSLTKTNPSGVQKWNNNDNINKIHKANLQHNKTASKAQ